MNHEICMQCLQEKLDVSVEIFNRLNDPDNQVSINQSANARVFIDLFKLSIKNVNEYKDKGYKIIECPLGEWGPDKCPYRLEHIVAEQKC